MLEINQVRLNHYRTLYYDTADFALYLRHHAGAYNRYKVRSREYLDSQLSFLEIKHKTGKSRTEKERLQTPTLLTHLNSDTVRFLMAHVPGNAHLLEPKLSMDFSRITLVSNQRCERLTLDLNLQLSSEHVSVFLPRLAVAEVKQPHFDRRSEFIRQMRCLGRRPSSFSKYCIGVSLLFPEVKHNRFKPILHQVDKIVGENDYVC